MTTFVLETNPADTGSTYYMVFFDDTGKAWGGSFITYTTTRDDFSQPMTEVAGTGLYTLTMPVLPEGEVCWSYYKQVGGTPSHSNDVRYKTGSGYSDGTGNIVSSTSSGGAVGPGADPVTITITDSETHLAIPDAQVWISSDSGGDIVIAGYLTTNSSGQVTFYLDAGVTYYLWMQKDGHASINGESFVAVAD